MTISPQDLKRAAIESGINPETLRSRLKRGIPLDVAVQLKPNSGPYAGVTRESKRTGIPISTLVSRINGGDTLAQAVEKGHPDAKPTIKLETIKKRQKAGDRSIRPAAPRQSGVMAVAKETGLSPQRVSELMKAGVEPDQIRRMRAKSETPRERRLRIERENSEQWRSNAQTLYSKSIELWLTSLVYLLKGWTSHAKNAVEEARSAERAGDWWYKKTQ